jgi:hypothetical protein
MPQPLPYKSFDIRNSLITPVLEIMHSVHITILDIIHRPVLYLNHDISETGFCLRLQVEPTDMGQIDAASLVSGEVEASSI